MARTHPTQINFRCRESEKEAYDALADSLESPLASIIRKALNKLVAKHLGSDWLEDE